VRFKGLLRRQPSNPSNPSNPPTKRGILSRLGLDGLHPAGRNVAHRELYVPGPRRRKRRWE